MSPPQVTPNNNTPNNRSNKQQKQPGKINHAPKVQKGLAQIDIEAMWWDSDRQNYLKIT